MRLQFTRPRLTLHTSHGGLVTTFHSNVRSSEPHDSWDSPSHCALHAPPSTELLGSIAAFSDCQSGLRAQSPNREQNSVKDRFRAWRAAGNVNINRDHLVYAAARGVIRAKNSAADAAGAHRDH